MLGFIAAIIVGLAVWITPKTIQMAKGMRGYEAIGGEFLIIPLAILIAFAVYEIPEIWSAIIGTWRDFSWLGNPEIACGEEVEGENGSDGVF